MAKKSTPSRQPYLSIATTQELLDRFDRAIDAVGVERARNRQDVLIPYVWMACRHAESGLWLSPFQAERLTSRACVAALRLTESLTNAPLCAMHWVGKQGEDTRAWAVDDAHAPVDQADTEAAQVREALTAAPDAVREWLSRTDGAPVRRWLSESAGWRG